MKNAEADLERRVSAYIGQMPFLWLNVPDAPSPQSARGRIERNAIALLSNARTPAVDRPSTNLAWLVCGPPSGAQIRSVDEMGAKKPTAVAEILP